jgi:hypothetical protein
VAPVEAAPPRRFASLASIEPAEEEPHRARYGHTILPEHKPAHQEAAPAKSVDDLGYEDDVNEPAPSVHQVRVHEADTGLPPEEDDLDVPAFIRRKVE